MHDFVQILTVVNVFYCNSSVSQYEHINLIHHFGCACNFGHTYSVFISNTILNFFKQVNQFVKFCFY